MKRALLLLTVPVLALTAYFAAQEPEEGFVLLHDGETHFGWTPEGGAWAAGRGVVVADGTAAGLLRSNTPLADFVMRFEAKVEKSAASAIVFRAAREGAPRETGYAMALSDLTPGAWVAVEVEAAGQSITVRSGGRTVDQSTGAVGQAGYIVLDAKRGGRVELRNLRVKLAGATSLFNGGDLSGWKATGEPAKQGGNMITKLFGKSKPKEAKWTVGKGVIHGAEGPGQLESLTAYGDFLLQAEIRINAKKADQKRRYALMFRGDAGQFGSGYEVNVQPGAMGALMGLTTARRSLGTVNQFHTLTVAAVGRRIAIWVDGVGVTDFLDVRPEGASPKKDARTAPGTIAFLTPEEDADFDIRNIRVVQLPKTFGHSAAKKGEAAQMPAAVQLPQMPALPAPAAPQAGGGADAQAQLMQQQMQQQQMEKMKQEQKQQQIAQLLQQGNRAGTPAEQVAIYDQILLLDPNNLVAFNARKDAVAKLDADAQKAAQANEQAMKQAASEQEKQMTLAGSIQAAEAAFLAGNLGGAEQALSSAEKIAPDNAQVRALRTRLDAARQRKESFFGLLGLGLAAVVVAALAWLFTLGRRKDPYLEIVDGLDKGKRYNIDKEVTMLGAIAEDGGAKNDVVLRDAERMISRFHAQIHFKEGKLYVVDTRSYNGTFVDKKRLEPGKPQPVKGGARINFAGTCTAKIGFEKRKKDKKG